MNENPPTRVSAEAAAEGAASIELIPITFRGVEYRVPKQAGRNATAFGQLLAEGKPRSAMEAIIGKKQTERFHKQCETKVVFVEGDEPEVYGATWDDYNAFWDAVTEVRGGNS